MLGCSPYRTRGCGVSVGFGRPFDQRRSHACAQGISLGIGQAEAARELTLAQSAVDDLRTDGIETKLRAPKQREVPAVVDAAQDR